jgi:hypothetical protein
MFLVAIAVRYSLPTLLTALLLATLPVTASPFDVIFPTLSKRPPCPRPTIEHAHLHVAMPGLFQDPSDYDDDEMDSAGNIYAALPAAVRRKLLVGRSKNSHGKSWKKKRKPPPQVQRVADSDGTPGKHKRLEDKSGATKQTTRKHNREKILPTGHTRRTLDRDDESKPRDVENERDSRGGSGGRGMTQADSDAAVSLPSKKVTDMAKKVGNAAVDDRAKKTVPAALLTPDMSEDPSTRVAVLREALEKKLFKVESLGRTLTFLERSVQLKRGQKKMQDGENDLIEQDAKESAKQLEDLKQKAALAMVQHEELSERSIQMQRKILQMQVQADALSESHQILSTRMRQLSVEDVVARRGRDLPKPVVGALVRSTEAMTPVLRVLVRAADTNQQLVDDVGAKIDLYTHVSVRKSPFLSGLVYYFVLLVPILAVVCCLRRVFDATSKMTLSHFVFLGNFYFLFLTTACIFASLALRKDPIAALHARYEKIFVTYNLSLAVYFFGHIVMLTLQAISTKERRIWAQVVATSSVGVHYFVFTWGRIFTASSPHMLLVNYCMYGTIFASIVYERCKSRATASLESIESKHGMSGALARFGLSAFAARFSTLTLLLVGGAREKDLESGRSMSMKCNAYDSNADEVTQGYSHQPYSLSRDARTQRDGRKTAPLKRRGDAIPHSAQTRGFAAFFFGAAKKTARSTEMDNLLQSSGSESDMIGDSDKDTDRLEGNTQRVETLSSVVPLSSRLWRVVSKKAVAVSTWCYSIISPSPPTKKSRNVGRHMSRNRHAISSRREYQ